jgi:hypothetical protein
MSSVRPRGLLKLKEAMKCSLPQLCREVSHQTARQSEALGRLRLKRPPLSQAFLDAASSYPEASALPSTRILTNAQLQWVRNSRAAISHAFDGLAADGMRAGGRLANNLNAALNEVCYHAIHALMCFDLIIQLSEASSGSSQRSAPIALNFDLHGMLSETVLPDIAALTREKFSVCPQIALGWSSHRAGRDLRNVLGRSADLMGAMLGGGQGGGFGDAYSLGQACPRLLEFVFVELLKNSLESVINRYGALNIEDEEASGK